MPEELFDVRVELQDRWGYGWTRDSDHRWDVRGWDRDYGERDVRGRDRDYGDENQALARSVAGVLSTHFLRARRGPVGSTAMASSTPDDHLIELIDEAADRRHRYRSAARYSLDSSGLGPDLPWLLVIISVPLGTLLASFMTEAGKDAYMGLKDLVGRLHAKVRQRRWVERSTVELHDPELGMRLNLADNLPDQAYRDLCAMELPRLPEGYERDRLLWREEYGWILKIRVPVRVGRRVVGKVAAELLWLPTNRWHVLTPPDYSWETDRFLEGLNPSDRQAFEAMRESVWPGTKKRRAEAQRREDALRAAAEVRHEQFMRKLEADRRRPPGPAAR